MIWAILGDFWPQISGFVGVASAAIFFVLRGKSSGKAKAENDFLKDKQKREQAGRDRLKAGRDSGLSPDERVRRNDGDWGGV